CREYVSPNERFITTDTTRHLLSNYLNSLRNVVDNSFIFNGEIGLLTAIHAQDQEFTVDFDGRIVTYTYQEVQDLEHAYAITIHKSQGSEFDIVVLPLYRPQPKLAYRNLLYTAVTRAKSLLVIVGTEEAIGQMIDNVRKAKRYTALNAFLTEGM
ncbi:MAG: ATP-binding domain-containing protein, partial [Clostridia bacterium]|nr:ATP-binding domain-containing protein [Clostridia bacterium]